MITIRAVTTSMVFGLAVSKLAAQAPPTDDRGVVVGAEARQFKLGTGTDAATIRQVSVPVGMTWARDRFRADLGSAWASSRLTRGDGSARTVSGLTDTQVRLSYTFGSDLLVASVVANLPTGLTKGPADDAPVLGAISSSFLGFPVASHGSGLSTTGGLALAVPAGQWNLGIAGSVRWSGEFTPYSDASGDLSYKPGIEGRVRTGVDRLVGRSRFTAGVTLSTFGTDEFGSGTTSTGLYRPGARWTVEAGWVAPLSGGSSLSIYGWHYLRSDGDSGATVVSNKERITAGGITWMKPLMSGLDLELGVDGRLAKVDEAPGRLVGAQLGLGVALGRRITLLPSVRYDTGSLDPDPGKLTIKGWGASVFIRSR